MNEPEHKRCDELGRLALALRAKAVASNTRAFLEYEPTEEEIKSGTYAYRREAVVSGLRVLEELCDYASA